MVLLEKYRPTLENWGTTLCGDRQKKVLSLFFNDDSKRLVLLTGPTGVGKTTIARLIAENWGIKPLHISCRNAGISGVRQAIETFVYKPLSRVNKKIYFFDEVDALSDAAQQSLLVDIENAPPYVYIFAATLYPDKLRTDFRSRFVPIELTVPSRGEIGQWLLGILVAENIDLPKNVGTEIINRSGGSFRLILHNLQNYIDGLGLVSDAEDAQDFVKALFSQKYSSTELLQIPIESYEGTTVAICKYALGILRRADGNSKNGAFALKVLQVFGDGLPTNMPADISFYKRLFEL